MLPRSDIIPLLTEYLDKRSEIEFAYIFGSFATRDRFEDIDIAVYLNDVSVLYDRETHHRAYSTRIALTSWC